MLNYFNSAVTARFINGVSSKSWRDVDW